MSQLYTPTSLEKGLKVLFLKYFSTESALAPRVAHIETSDSDAESYDWLGQSPTMQEFLDERRSIPLSETKYTITNKTWESTITVARNDLADNKTGGIQRRIQQMAATAAGHQNKLVIDALVNGTKDLCYDGTAMFGNSHTARADEGGVQDNLLGGTGSTTAQVGADLVSAKAAMLKFKGENGEPFHGDGVPSLTVVCPPDMEKSFREVLNAQIISNTSNVANAGAAGLIVSPRLTDTDDWYLLRTDSTRSLIMQDREPLEFTSLEGTSDQGFIRDSYAYGIRARYNIGYAFWQCAVKMVN